VHSAIVRAVKPLTCCGPEAQSDCCDPKGKAACCGTAGKHAAGTCACL
jgi:hypothetical protein